MFLAWIFIPALIIVIAIKLSQSKRKVVIVASNATTSPQPVAINRNWFIVGWIVVAIILFHFGEAGFHKLTTPKEITQINSFTPTSRLKLKHVSRSGKVDLYMILSLQRSANNIFIRCQNNLNLLGSGTGNGEYKGSWDQGVNNGSFQLKFSDANTAEGTIEEAEGNIPLTISSL
jgi:hypothetical protein